MRRCVAFVGLLFAQSACAAPVFECASDASCGPQGRCEADGACSFPDDTCPSGRRYGEFAGSVGGMCVAAEGTDASGSSDPLTTSSSTATSEPMSDADSTHAVVDTSTSSDVSTSDASTTTTDASSSSSSGSIEFAPIQIVDDFDDGAMLADDMAVVWLPSGERGLGGFLGEFPLGQPYFGYFRFALPEPIPADATVSSAVLELRGWTTYMWNAKTDALVVSVEVSADAPQVEGVDAFPAVGNTVLGPEAIRWPTDGGLAWNVEGSNLSPDLSPLLQMVVDTYGGLQSGSHVQFWISKAELGVMGTEVGYVDAFNDAMNAATLSIQLQ